MGVLTLLCLMTAVAYTYQATVPTYVIELYIVVDKAVVDKYITERTESSAAAKEAAARANIEDDANYFLTELNEIMASLSSEGLNIEVRKRKLDILSTNVHTGSSTVDVDSGLPAFQTWLSDENSFNALNFDLAMLWTGFELTRGGSNSTAGFASVGTVCEGDIASSLVEYDGTFNTLVTSAHELAHNLGVNHDSGSAGYIMAPSSSADSANRWSFSLGSVGQMITKIDDLGSNNCLLSTNSASSVPSQTITDELEDPDNICTRRLDDQSSYMCKGEVFYGDAIPQGDAVCRQLYCAIPGSTYCRNAFSSDGLICGTSKRCNEGTCQPDSGSGTANIDPNCIWGDQKKVRIGLSSGLFQGTCSDLIDQEGKGICYSSIETACCGSCKAVHTGISGCEYGDAFGNCAAYDKDWLCPVYAESHCCEYCHGFSGKRDADENVNKVHLPPLLEPIPVVKNLQTKEPEKPKKPDQPPMEE